MDSVSDKWFMGVGGMADMSMASAFRRWVLEENDLEELQDGRNRLHSWGHGLGIRKVEGHGANGRAFSVAIRNRRFEELDFDAILQLDIRWERIYYKVQKRGYANTWRGEEIQERLETDSDFEFLRK